MNRAYGGMNPMGPMNQPDDMYYYEGGSSNRGMSRRGSNSGRNSNGYSGHSISDQAVERLENLMDKAGSDYEKEQLHKYIRMIRMVAQEG